MGRLGAWEALEPQGVGPRYRPSPPHLHCGCQWVHLVDRAQSHGVTEQSSLLQKQPGVLRARLAWRASWGCSGHQRMTMP